MDRPTRTAIVPIALLLCGLAGCVVEGPPPPRQVVVERPPPREVVVERRLPEWQPPFLVATGHSAGRPRPLADRNRPRPVPAT